MAGRGRRDSPRRSDRPLDLFARDSPGRSRRPVPFRCFRSAGHRLAASGGGGPRARPRVRVGAGGGRGSLCRDRSLPGRGPDRHARSRKRRPAAAMAGGPSHAAQRPDRLESEGHVPRSCSRGERAGRDRDPLMILPGRRPHELLRAHSRIRQIRGWDGGRSVAGILTALALSLSLAATGEDEARALIDKARPVAARGGGRALARLVEADRATAYEAVDLLLNDGDPGDLPLAGAMAAAYERAFA